MDVRRGRVDAQPCAAWIVVLIVAAGAIDSDVLELAKAGEPERYLAATLTPERHRAALIALAAFSADLRRIPNLVKEPLMGEIRLQWWRDAIERYAGDEAPTGHPVADALRIAVRQFDLRPALLVAMTEARAFDLYPDPMPDRAAFDGYLAKTEGAPFTLALSVLGMDAGKSEGLGNLAGRCYGLARLLADLPHRLARGRHPLPLDLLRAHNVDGDTLLAGVASPQFSAALRELTSDVRTSYDVLRSRWRELPRDQRTALLPNATITAYLAGLETTTRDPLREPFELQPLTRVWRMARAHWIGL